MIEKNKKAISVLNELKELYPDAKCELNYSNNFELLVATILSAQSTDKKVNEITTKLFKDYNAPEDFMTLTHEELQNKIKKIGLYRNKAKHIQAMSEILVKDFSGDVPCEFKDLISLPGVGRKTANVVLSNGFGVPAIAVDTHVFRVANRIGLASSEKVEEVEKQLMDSIPKDMWSLSHHLLIWHGRRICHARNPRCETCKISYLCDFYHKNASDQYM